MAPRNRSWADSRFLAATLAINAEVHTNLLANAPTVDTLTAVRIVGDLIVEFDPTSTHSDQLNLVEVGIGVTSTEAFAAGSASLPSVASETEYPPRGWLYLDGTTCMNTIDATNQAIQMRPARFQFDVRAMRKIDKGILFMSIASRLGKGGGVTTLISGRVRVLCLT